MIATKIGSSIEGSQLELSTRKFYPVLPIWNSVLGAMVYGFRLQVYGVGTIIEELSPKKPVIKANSMLSIDDQIRGERVVGFSSKPLSNPRVYHATGRHRATAIIAKKFGFAKIEIGVRHLLQRK